MLRNCARLAVGLSHCHALRHRCSATHRLPLGLCQLAPLHTQDLVPKSSMAAHLDLRKDFTLPNASWKKELMELYDKFMELAKSGTWKRIPSYNSIVHHFSETESNSQSRTRLFTRNLDEEGTGLEYVLFFNHEDKRVVGLFQIGPYLEGPPGFTHGGCIATIIDTVTGACAMCNTGEVMTANLNINYRNPVPLGSVVVAESHVDRIEGRKVFMSSCIRSADDTILHTEATVLFISLKWNESEQ